MWTAHHAEKAYYVTSGGGCGSYQDGGVLIGGTRVSTDACVTGGCAAAACCYNAASATAAACPADFPYAYPPTAFDNCCQSADDDAGNAGVNSGAYAARATTCLESKSVPCPAAPCADAAGTSVPEADSRPMEGGRPGATAGPVGSGFRLCWAHEPIYDPSEGLEAAKGFLGAFLCALHPKQAFVVLFSTFYTFEASAAFPVDLGTFTMNGPARKQRAGQGPAEMAVWRTGLRLWSRRRLPVPRGALVRRAAALVYSALVPPGAAQVPRGAPGAHSVPGAAPAARGGAAGARPRPGDGPRRGVRPVRGVRGAAHGRRLGREQPGLKGANTFLAFPGRKNYLFWFSPHRTKRRNRRTRNR